MNVPSKFYEAKLHPDYNVADCLTAEAAASLVEEAGAGSVVEFTLERNLPHCLPEYVARSCALWGYENGVWRGYAIFGGTSSWEERPN